MSGKDSRWSWAILGVVVFTTFLEGGIVKGFSILLPSIKEQLVTNTWIIGSCISIFTGWGFVLGLTASALVKKFGPRRCFMICGLVSSIGLIISACATSVGVLLLGLVLSGCLLLQENIVIGIVPNYFDRYFTIAVNVYTFGNVISVMVIPLFTQMLLDTYGWRGAAIMLSGLSLHSIPSGALLKQQLQVNEDEKALLLTSNENLSTESNKATTRLNVLQAIRKKVDAALLTRLPFIARVLLPSFVWGYTFTGWMIYIVSFVLSNGSSMRESSIVATCGGIGLASIKIALPFIYRIMTHTQLMYISSFIMAISLVLTAALKSSLGMNMASVMYGIGVGILGSQVHIANRDIASETEYINAISWFHVVYGFAAILGGTLTGVIYDVTESFNFSFATLSAVSFLTAVSLGIEDIWARMIKSRKS